MYYTTNPDQPVPSWNSKRVDSDLQMTTISKLSPLAIYAIVVKAVTIGGLGLLSEPVKLETQQAGKNDLIFI